MGKLQNWSKGYWRKDQRMSKWWFRFGETDPSNFSSCAWCSSLLVLYFAFLILIRTAALTCILPCPDLPCKRCFMINCRRTDGLTSIWLYSKSMPCTDLSCILDARKFLACNVWFLFECLLQVPCESQNRDCASHLWVPWTCTIFHGDVLKIQSGIKPNLFGILK